MNYLRRLLIIIIGLFGVVFLISFFLPSSFQYQSSIRVKANQEIVFNQVNDLKKWKEWSSWASIDPSIYNNPNAFSGNSKGIGAKFSWESDNDEIGQGYLEITNTTPNQFVEYVCDFGMGESIGVMNFNETPEGVEVVWGFSMDFGFNPFAKIFGLFMEDYIAPDYQKGLKKLKTYVENLPQINSGKVQVEKLNKPQWFLSIRDTVNQMQMSNIHGKLYNEINKFMDEQGIQSSLPPLVIYHYWSDTLVDIEAGIQIIDSIKINHTRIELNKIDTGKIVSASHFGPYERLPETYFSINEWMRKNEVEILGPPWEIYETDPASESNPEKWETKICFPIK